MNVNITFQRKGGFGKLGPKTLKLLSQVVRKTALDVEGEAKRLIMTGPKTGRIYRAEQSVTFVSGGAANAAFSNVVSFAAYKGKKGHQASAPGEAPATDTGNLASGINAERKSKLEYWVRSSAEYSLDLEYGTTKMAARPFMTPATGKYRVPFRKACEIAIRKGAQQG